MKRSDYEEFAVMFRQLIVDYKPTRLELMRTITKLEPLFLKIEEERGNWTEEHSSKG